MRHRWVWTVALALVVAASLAWLVGELSQTLSEAERERLWLTVAHTAPPDSLEPSVRCELAIQAAGNVRETAALRPSRRPPLPSSPFEEARVYAATLDGLFLHANPQTGEAVFDVRFSGRGPVPTNLVLASATSLGLRRLSRRPPSIVAELSDAGCDFEWLRSETLAAFWRANRTEHALSMPFLLPVDHRTVRGDLWAMWSDMESPVFNRVPGSNGVIGLSRVGFDRQGDQAMVFVEYACGGNCGEGFLVVLERGPRGWSVVELLKEWVS